MNRTQVALSFLLSLLLALCLYRLSYPSRVSALQEGPPAGKTGAPGEGTCHDCHTSNPINHPSGGVTIDGLPDSYVAGRDPLDFTVTVFQDGTGGANKDWGFELTALDDNNLFAGTLVATDTTNTKIVCGEVDGNARHYIEHTLAGSFLNPAGASHATWNITWVPPDTGVGPVTFYVAGNAGTGQHMRLGTYVFTNNQTVLGPGAEFLVRALPLSDLRHLLKGTSLVRAAWAPRSTSLGSYHYRVAYAPRRNGVVSVIAPGGARHTRG